MHMIASPNRSAPGSSDAPSSAPGSAVAPSSAPGSSDAPSSAPGSAVAPSASGSAGAPSPPGSGGAPSAPGSAGATSTAEPGVAISALVAAAPADIHPTAPDTGGVGCSALSEPATRALPASSSAPNVYVSGPMMAEVIKAVEEGGADPFLAYGIETGSDDDEMNDDEAEDAVGAQAGDDADLRTAELRAAELCAGEVRVAELHDAEVHKAELCAAEVRAVELRAPDERVAEVRASEVYIAELHHGNDLAAAPRRERTWFQHLPLSCRRQGPRSRGWRQNAINKAQLESLQRQLSAEVAGTSVDEDVRDPSDPQVRMENVHNDFLGNPIIPSSLTDCDTFNDVMGKTYDWLITASPAGDMEFYPLWEEFQPHHVCKYVAEGTTQDQYYLFMGGNSKRVERALALIGTKRANMNKPIKLWAWGAGGYIDKEKWHLLKIGGITPTKAHDAVE
ncbi:unnamed protein product [Closterium sp. Yama58-4]|nr:unnamed protein product [Closterium sp. Yama58-4]